MKVRLPPIRATTADPALRSGMTEAISDWKQSSQDANLANFFMGSEEWSGKTAIITQCEVVFAILKYVKFRRDLR